MSQIFRNLFKKRRTNTQLNQDLTSFPNKHIKYVKVPTGI